MSIGLESRLLCRSNTDEGRRQILETLDPTVLLDAMGLFSTCADVQIAGNNLLGIFALDSAAHRRLVLARGGHLLTLRSMRDFADNLRMQEIGCWCLRTLTANRLHSHTFCHAHVSCHSHANARNTTAALRKDLAVRAPPVLVAAMARFGTEESLHVHCLDALAALVRGCDRARLAEYRVPTAVSASMHTFRANPAVLAHATALLRILAQSSLCRVSFCSFSCIFKLQHKKQNETKQRNCARRLLATLHCWESCSAHSRHTQHTVPSLQTASRSSLPSPPPVCGQNISLTRSVCFFIHTHQNTDCSTLVQHLGDDKARRVPTIVATAHPSDEELQAACKAYVRALQSSASCTLL